MGLWNMPTPANKKEAESGEKYETHNDQRPQCRGGLTVAAAVVFHWSLERVGVLLQEACVVT